MTRGGLDLQNVDLLLFRVGGFLATGLAEFKFELLPLIEQGRTLIANRLQGQALAKGFTDADGIGGFAVHFKDGKAIECAIGIFTGCNYAAQKDGIGADRFVAKQIVRSSAVLIGIERNARIIFITIARV